MDVGVLQTIVFPVATQQFSHVQTISHADDAMRFLGAVNEHLCPMVRRKRLK